MIADIGVMIGLLVVCLGMARAYPRMRIISAALLSICLLLLAAASYRSVLMKREKDARRSWRPSNQRRRGEKPRK